MSTPQPSSSAYQFMTMAAAASDMRRLFEAYVSAGFTEEQAMRFLLAMLSGAVGCHR